MRAYTDPSDGRRLFANRYATKQEQMSNSCGKLLDFVLKRAKEREIGDDDSASRVFASYLCQQVGGRDWSAQEVRCSPRASSRFATPLTVT